MNKQTKALKMVIDNLELQDFNTVNAGLIAYCKEALAQDSEVQEPNTFKHLSEEEKKQCYKVAKRIQKAIGVETPTIAANACLLVIELSCWVGRNMR